ncbi:FG-nucleoporin NUP57 [Sporobolomyces koalae]|uniref:FG-nucleoporin NUP57 n=1 Tax=Sporobolomyces koalae TaxID=500713 RepID=UPI00316E4782
MAFSFGAPAAPKPAASTFSFGAPAAPSTSTPSLFGATSAATSTPSLFGSTPAPAAPSLFGNTQSTATSTPAPTGGLFGSSATPAASTSLFGAPKPAATPSLFGQPPASSTPTSTSLFGQPSGSTSLFGQSQPAQQAPAPAPAVTSAPLFGQSQTAATNSLFGAKPAAAPATLSLFGSTTTTAAPTSSFLQQSQLQQSTATVRKLGEPPLPNPLEKSIESRIEAIKNSYDPTHPQCRFQTYFYNEPAMGQNVKSYARPPNGTDDKAWTKAVRENPDPDHLVPAIAIGFSAVQKRIEHQQRQTLTHQQLLTEIQSHVSELASKHALETSLRTLRAQQTSISLLSRLTAVVAQSSALSPGRNASLKPEEERLRIELERLQLGVEAVRNRGNELWTRVGTLRSRKLEHQAYEWAVADEHGFNQILDILNDQQRGLDHLTKTLNGMSRDVDTMNEAFGLPLKSQPLTQTQGEQRN